jgi:glycosyltransferase involved in cell wall biosynthesis
MHRRQNAAPEAVLVSSNPEAPSFRHRFLPVLPELESHGLRPRVEVPHSGPPALRLLANRRRLAAASVVVLAKVKLDPIEAKLMRRLCRRIVFDFDDAVYAVRPRVAGHQPRRSLRRKVRFASICRVSDLVVACNRTLAAEAQLYARRVEIVATPINVADYPNEPSADRHRRTLVWIGMPENLRYLELIRPVLARLAAELDGVKLRIVCSRAPDWPEVPIELLPWSEATEVESIRTAGIGIMPLADDDWSAGKCAFKILQYMAAGLPCVASRVGMNADVVVDGVNGLLAGPQDEWYLALRDLLTSDAFGRELGAAGRRHVEHRFDTAKVAPRMAELISSVALGPTRSEPT